MQKCKNCGTELSAQSIKRKNTICSGCKISSKFLKNGGNTRDSRLPIAISHLTKIGIEKTAALHPVKPSNSN